ncbi:MAG: ribonuclease H-like YkuK family protein [Patescibacteria group bacterium]|nr:ribonuclease H-like YkuK family protein [Patescibacteria group bacterium]
MFNSPTYGKLDIDQLKKIIRLFMSQEKTASYNVIVGTDSQRTGPQHYDFISALIIHRVGSGGIYFWRRTTLARKISLKERIYLEAMMSLEMSESFVEFFKTNGISRYRIQIHVDIGKEGETRELIKEVTTIIRSNGYQPMIKPEAYGASKIADRHT